ncbi:unnamed protein product, partial [Mesorhabditis spiculigera]
MIWANLFIPYCDALIGLEKLLFVVAPSFYRTLHSRHVHRFMCCLVTVVTITSICFIIHWSKVNDYMTTMFVYEAHTKQNTQNGRFYASFALAVKWTGLIILATVICNLIPEWCRWLNLDIYSGYEFYVYVLFAAKPIFHTFVVGLGNRDLRKKIRSEDMEGFTPRTAASAPGALLKDTDLVNWLEKKLGDSEEWGGRNAASFLSKEMIEELETCFQRLETNIKVKLLTAILHVQPRLMANWKQEMCQLIYLGHRDPDDWVEAIAELIKDLPNTGRITFEAPASGEGHYSTTLQELKNIMKRHAQAGDLRLLPPSSRIVSETALKQQFGVGELEREKHFTLKRKPKSHLLKIEMLKQAEAAANPAAKSKLGSVHSLPICKVRSTARIGREDIPMRGMVQNTCKLSAGFSNEPKKFQRPALKREGGAKLLDINEIPQALKKRKCDVLAEERKRKAEEKEEAKKQERALREAKQEEMRKKREEERLEAEKRRQEKIAQSKAKANKVVRNDSVTSQASLDETIEAVIKSPPPPPKPTPKVSVEPGPIPRSIFDKAIQNETEKAVGSLTPDSPHGGLFQPIASTSTERKVAPQPSPLLSPASSASPMQSPSYNTGGLFASVEPTPPPPQQTRPAPKNPVDERIYGILNQVPRQPAPESQPENEITSHLFQPIQQQVREPQQPAQISQQRSSSGELPAFRLSHMNQPPRQGLLNAQGQPIRVLVQQAPLRQVQAVPVQQVVQQQQPQQHQQQQQQQQQVQQQPQPRMFQTIQQQTAPNGQTIYVRRTVPVQQQPGGQIQAQQPQQQQPQFLRQAVQRQPEQPPMDKTELVRRQCEEMLRTANSLDAKSRKIVVDFMCGNKVNPRPDIGQVLTIKLSENIEDGVMNGMQAKWRAETFFQMDFSTGEWKRLRKCKLLTNAELEQLGYSVPQQQQQAPNMYQAF